MEQRDYEEIGEALQKAEEDVTPFLVTEAEEPMVVGDANKTEMNLHDFTIRFRVPTKAEDGKWEYPAYDKEYKDVGITPRMQPKVLRHITALMPFYKKVMKGGSIEEYTLEEQLHIIEDFGEDIIDIMYDLTATVLKIDADLKDYMVLDSVADAAKKIIRMYPEVVNEADTFFG